jgi:hypothetical protein
MQRTWTVSSIDRLPKQRAEPLHGWQIIPKYLMGGSLYATRKWLPRKSAC